MTTDFLHQRHKTYTTPQSQIFALIRHVTGQTPVHSEKIVRGYDNEVYAVATEQCHDYIVRIAQHGETGYAEEAWAIEQCRQTGVPVPELCHIGTVMVDDRPRAVMVQRRVAGRALVEFAHTLNRDELLHSYAQAGAALSRIHSVHVDGFYKRRPDGLWDFPDWASITRANLRDRTAEQPALRQVGFTQREIEQLLLVVAAAAPPADTQPVLCHGDFHADHLFFDEQLTLTGVIDFGEFQGGLPVVDFVRFTLTQPDVNLSWLCAGYANQAVFDETFMLRLQQGQVSYLIGYLAHCAKIRNVAEIKKVTAQLRVHLST